MRRIIQSAAVKLKLERALALDAQLLDGDGKWPIIRPLNPKSQTVDSFKSFQREMSPA
jgi:hypothetical protein